jgi:hypothetical protein
VNPEPVEIIADSIIKIAESFRKMNDTRLRRGTIVTLISAYAKGITRRDIITILDTCESLDKIYLK